MQWFCVKLFLELFYMQGASDQTLWPISIQLAYGGTNILFLTSFLHSFINQHGVFLESFYWWYGDETHPSKLNASWRLVWYKR